MANYVTVVEDRPIMSLKYCLPVPVFHFWAITNPPCSAVSAIAELLVRSVIYTAVMFYCVVSSINEMLVFIYMHSGKTDSAAGSSIIYQRYPFSFHTAACC